MARSTVFLLTIWINNNNEVLEHPFSTEPKVHTTNKQTKNSRENEDVKKKEGIWMWAVL